MDKDQPIDVKEENLIFSDCTLNPVNDVKIEEVEIQEQFVDENGIHDRQTFINENEDNLPISVIFKIKKESQEKSEIYQYALKENENFSFMKPEDADIEEQIKDENRIHSTGPSFKENIGRSNILESCEYRSISEDEMKNDNLHSDIEKCQVTNCGIQEGSKSTETTVLNVYNQKENYKMNEDTQQQIPLTKNKNPVLCPLCFEEIGHFSRHLERKHADDETVKKIMRMPPGSIERRTALMALRKKGNYLLKNETTKLKKIRNINNAPLDADEDYYPCVNCLGFYRKTYLWRHRKHCKANRNNEFSHSNNHATNAQTFLVTTGVLGNFLKKSRIRKEVFSIMRPDNISYIAKSDPLICLYGESYLNKHKRKQMSIVASIRMREMARLKISIMKSIMITSLIDVLKPSHYEHLVASAKVVCGYDPSERTFKSSSLALHYRTNLKFLCDVAKRALLTNDPLFNYEDNEKEGRLKNIIKTREVIASQWCDDVSSLANKVLKEINVNKPKMLNVTEDVKVFNDFIKNKADEAYRNLENNINSSEYYKVLIECVLVHVLIFNRRRVEEIQFLEIRTYKKKTYSINQDELMCALTAFEMAMSSSCKIVVVFGRGSRAVPLLFTNLMQKYISLILEVRERTEIVPKANPYLFANPGFSDRWMSGPNMLRQYAHLCEAKNPEALTCTRFSKQVASILQIMSFEEDGMQQIATFMGHTEHTHKEFCRMSEDIHQMAKVAKVVILLNEGKGKEFKGKSLADIEIAEDFLALEQEENMEEQKVKSNHQTQEESNIAREMIWEESHDTEEPLKPRKEEDDGKDMLYTSKPTREEKTKRITRRKKQKRHTWLDEEKRYVLNHFKNHVESKKAPKKHECLDLIAKHPTVFKTDDWIRIKTFVYNAYRQN